MSEYYEVSRDDYFISTNNKLLDVDIIHYFLSEESYWAEGIPKSVVVQSVENSLCFGLYFHNKQVGFARLITDRATFAYLADVFIIAPHRGKGLSKWLMQCIHKHPELEKLRRWMLGTRDAHGLYKQFGWTSFTEEVSKRFMEKHNPDVYRK